MTTLLSPEITTVASLTERCDRCSAAARLEVTLASGGELAFCSTICLLTCGYRRRTMEPPNSFL